MWVNAQFKNLWMARAKDLRMRQRKWPGDRSLLSITISVVFFFLFRNNMHSLAFTWSDNTMLIKNWFLFPRSQWAIERASISEGFRECCTMFVGCTAGRLAAARVTARSQQMWAAAAAWARHLRLANPINNHHPRSIRWHCVCAELEGKLFKCHLIVWLSLDTTNKHKWKFNKQTNKLL